MNNHKPSDKYRDRLTRNAEDFNSIVSGLLDELDSMAAWEQAKALKEEARDELHGMATNNHKELRERLREVVSKSNPVHTLALPVHEMSTLLDLVDRLEREKEAWRHVANEWADAATNGPQYLKNVRDGISTVEEALTGIAGDLAHCRAVSDAAMKEEE